jgi:hypothetical protein
MVMTESIFMTTLVLFLLTIIHFLCESSVSAALTAAVGVGIPRYTVGMWPAMMTALALGAGWLADAVVARAVKRGL